MSNKIKLVEDNLEELSDRIGLLVKQYNLLAESENLNERRLLVVAMKDEVGPADQSHMPSDIYDVVTEYNDAQGWSSSASCY